VIDSSDAGREQAGDEDDEDTLVGLSAGAGDDIPLDVPSRLSNSGYVAGPNVQIGRDVGRDVIVDSNIVTGNVIVDSNLIVGSNVFVGGDASAADEYAQALGQPVALDTRTRYQAAIEKIFARCPEPVDRAVEFAQVTDFLTGDEPYFWWMGEPYCGKTTLAAAIAAAPPPNVVTVAFFVDRLGGTRLQDFRTAVADQLAPLAGQPRTRYAEPRGFDLDDLWQLATERVRAAGKTLLLIADGLDEDDWVRFREPSVASQLPESCPHGSRVLVTSRQVPEVLASVSENHPLRRCGPRLLRPNEASSKSREAAVQELRHAIDDPDRVTARTNRAVLGVLAAAGGHLTADDLTELAKVDADRYEVTQVLEQTLGRLVEPRDEFGERRYVFAHDLIVSQATTLLGSAALRQHREWVGTWAARFAAEGWPDQTPTYLLDQYPRLLFEEGDTPGLLTLQVPERYRRLYDRFGSSHVAMQGLTDLTTLLAHASEPDLAAMLRLSLWASHFKHATYTMPSEIPEGWALLGQTDKAAHLARSIGDNFGRIKALCSVARACDHAGQTADAQELLEAAEYEALALPDSLGRVFAITHVARALAESDDHARGRELLALAFPSDEQLPAPDRDRVLVERFDRSLTAIATTAATIGSGEMALRALASLSAQARIGAAEITVRRAGQAGSLDLATQIALAYPRCRPLLVTVAARAGNRDLAAELVEEYLEPLNTLSKSGTLTMGNAKLNAAMLAYAMASVKAGLFEQAEQLARRLNQQHKQQRVLLSIARVAALQGDTETVIRVLTRCAAVKGGQGAVLRTIATRALWASQDGDQARVSRLLDLATSLAGLSDGMADPQLKNLASSIVAALAEDRADLAAERVSNIARVARSTMGAARDTRLAGIARVATILGIDTEAVASLITSPHVSDSAFAGIVVAAGRKRDFDRAERLIERIVDGRMRLDALRGLVIALADADRFDEAVQLARRMPEHSLRTQAVSQAATLAIDGGFLREAESILASGIIPSPTLSRRLASLAKAWIAIDRPARAAELLAKAEKYASAVQRVGFLGTPPDRLLVNVQATGALDLVDATAAFISAPGAKAQALAALPRRTQRVGEHGRNRRLLDLAERSASEVDEAETRATLLIGIVRGALKSADDEQVSRYTAMTLRVIQDEIPDVRQQVVRLTRLAQLFGEYGERGECSRMLLLACDRARAVPGVGNQGNLLTFICRHAIGNGLLDLAESIAASIASSPWRAAALTRTAAGAWHGKNHKLARRLIKDAEQMAARTPGQPRRAVELTHIARVAALAHDFKTARRLVREAEDIAAQLTRPDRKAFILAEAVRAAEGLADPVLTERLIGEACDFVATVEDPDVADWIALNLLRHATAAGLLDLAERTARSIHLRSTRYFALGSLAVDVAATGPAERARSILERASEEAARISDYAARTHSFNQLARSATLAGFDDLMNRIGSQTGEWTAGAWAATRIGRFAEAERLARLIRQAERRDTVIAELARATYASGDHALAERLIITAFKEGAMVLPLDVIVSLHPPAAAAIATTLQEIRDQAEELQPKW
jgi:hypothetical protein